MEHEPVPLVVAPSEGSWCGRCGVRLDDPHRVGNRRLVEPDYDGVHTDAECDAELEHLDALVAARRSHPSIARIGF